jgi:hypothetical protein
MTASFVISRFETTLEKRLNFIGDTLRMDSKISSNNVFNKGKAPPERGG